jgi:amino-acid N-acetyltransferase
MQPRLANTTFIRPACAKDQAVIRSMVHAEPLDPTHLHWSGFLVAVTMNGSIVGIGQVRPHLAGRELGSLVVVPEWRGKGVASALVRALLNRERGPVFLQTTASKVDFYRRFGFETVDSWSDAPWPLVLKASLASLWHWQNVLNGESSVIMCIMCHR